MIYKHITFLALVMASVEVAFAGLPVKYFTSRLPDDPVVLGEWNIGLEKCLKYSRENDIPLFAMWTEKGCGVCTSWGQALTDAGVRKDKGEEGYGFVDWLKNGIDPKSRIVLCIMSSGEAKGESLPGQYPLPDQRYSDPYYWIWKGDDFLNFRDPFAWKGSITYWPFMAFYWQSHKIDYHCEAESICSGDYSFSEYPVRLIAKIDQIFADYQGPKPSYRGGQFAVTGDSPHHRMEIQKGLTTTLKVPFTREDGVDYDYTNRLTAVFGKSSQTVDVVWKPHDATATGSVTVPGGMAVGDSLTLILKDADGKGVATNSALFVDARNTPSNPHWIGEYTAQSLPLGEWTMDLDRAKQKVAAYPGDAFTLVLITGSLWCPHCKGLERQVLDTSRFRQFAKDNNLALVELDNPNRPGKSARPTLLDYTPSQADSYVPPGKSASEMRHIASGAAYMTRHAVDPALAAETLVRNQRLGYGAIADGGYRPAEFEWSPYPTVLLLNKQGQVVGHIPGKSGGGLQTEVKYPYVEDPVAQTNDLNAASGDKVALLDVDATFARLEDLVALARRGVTAHDDDPETLPPENFLNAGEYGIGSLCACDLVDFWCVTGSAKRVRTSVRSASGDGPVTVTFYTEVLGIPFPIGEPVSGRLQDGVICSEETGDRPLWIEIRADPTNMPAVFSPFTKADSFRTYSLNTTEVLVPGIMTEVRTVSALLGEIAMYLEENKVYRITGVDRKRLAEVGLTAVEGGNDLYSVAETGEIELPLDVPSGAQPGETKEIAFARFETAEIGFQKTSASFAESCGTAAFVVERKNPEKTLAEVRGTVTLVVDTNDVTCADSRRYSLEGFGWYPVEDGKGGTNWLHDVVFAEGDSTPVVIAFKVVDDDGAAFGEQWLDFKLDREVGTATAIADGFGVFTAVLEDEDVATIGHLAIADTWPTCVRRHEMVVQAGDNILVKVTREGGFDHSVSASLQFTDIAGKPIGTPENHVWYHNDVGNAAHWFILAVPEGFSEAVVELVPQNGITALASASKIHLTILSDGDPVCGTETIGTEELVLGASWTGDYELSDPKGGNVSAVLTTGSLPGGLTGGMVGSTFRVSGRPQRTGTYSATYRVAADRDGTTVLGESFTVAIRVIGLEQAARENPDDYPAFEGGVRIFENVLVTVPVPANPYGASKCAVGSLSVTIPANGRASAKLMTANGTYAYSAEGWSESDENNAMVVRLLGPKAAQAFGGTGIMTVRCYPEGGVIAEFDLGEANPQEVSLVRSRPAAANLGLWNGYYTVQMPQGEGAAGGTVTMALKMTDAVPGRMTFAGTLPNGRSVSGSALLEDGVSARNLRLPFFCSSTGALGSLLAGRLLIDRDGKAQLKTAAKGVIHGDSEAHPRWTTDPDAGAPGLLDVRGAYYDGTITAYCRGIGEGYDPANLRFTADGETFSSSLGTLADFAIPVSLENDTVTLLGPGNPFDAKFSYSPETGVLSGSFLLPITLEDKTGTSNVLVNFSGVMLPGWMSPAGCGACGEGYSPVFAGSCWFAERNGKTVFVNGCGVQIDKPAE